MSTEARRLKARGIGGFSIVRVASRLRPSVVLVGLGAAQSAAR